ncbi:MAG: hypothetical protein V3U79_08795 [Dehalococcoidia bacterium]
MVILSSLALGLLIWQACGGGGDLTARPSDASDGGTTTLFQGLGPDLEGLLATIDLGVGANRVAFLLQTPDGLITLPRVMVTSSYFPEDGSDPLVKETTSATFHLWPFGTRGNYVTEMSFDSPGQWQLEAKLTEGDTVLASATMSVLVREASHTPAVGSVPPLTVNKTLGGAEGLSEITGWVRADPELYQLTIPEALASGKPLVVVMSSPGFCTSPTCGPQVDTVVELKEIYKGQANFIHVEVYDNPQEIQESLDQGRYTQVVKDWGLTDIEGYLNESWVFIIDGSGRIVSKYEGYSSIEELERGLQETF